MAFGRVYSYAQRVDDPMNLLQKILRLLPALMLPAVGCLHAEQIAQIFILHSYSQEYPWTQAQHMGFMQTLDDDLQLKVAVSTEYLDTKRRAYDAAYADDLARHLELKYANYRPAAIYVSDDNALLFARDHLSKLFPGTPVFFSGINDYDVWKTLDPTRFTGVFELKEVAPNLKWLLTVDPKANDLIFVGDGSNTYQAIETEARKELVPSHLRATFISETKLDRAAARVRELPGKYVFLTTVGGMTDADGQVLPLRDIIKGLAIKGRVVISMEDGYVMEGVLGGWVTSGVNHGKGAARLLVSHLHGTPVAALPPVLKSPNAMIFDDQALQDCDITLPENLRKQALLLHPRPGFYEQNRTLILGSLKGLAGVLFLVVAGTLVILSRNNRELNLARNRAEAATIHAELANAAKSEFLASMSHEIRTPLNAIIGLSEIIQGDPGGPHTEELLQTIRSSGDSLLSVISDILDFSKIESGQFSLESEGMDLRQCVEDSMRIVSTLAAKKGLKLESTIDPALPEVIRADMMRLRQVLLNLLMNGVKFTEHGWVSLHILRREDPESGPWIEFAVADSGIGISAAQQTRLFQSFSQVDASTTRRYGGTGLGLAISQRIVQMMGGIITLESTPQIGSTFRFSIPLVAAQYPQANPLPLPDAPPTARVIPAQQPKFCPLNIIVAEDNPTNQRVIVLMLSQLGYQATVVANGTELLDALESSPCDLAFIDVQMPVMDGLEAATRIRAKYPPDRRPYMIALTANAMKEDRETCLAAGMDNFLTKPIRLDKLTAVLKEVCELGPG